MRVEHLSQWGTGWKALSQFRCPSLSEAFSDSADRSDFSHLGSPKPWTSLFLWPETGRMHGLGTEWAVLTREISEVQSTFQDLSSEQAVVGGRVPSFPARSNTSKQTSPQNLRAGRAHRGSGPCAEGEAKAQGRCRLAQHQCSEPFALGHALTHLPFSPQELFPPPSLVSLPCPQPHS